MMKLDHRRCRTLIARSFERGGLPEKEASAVRAHVRDCPSCEHVYERFAAAEAALYPGTPGRDLHAGQVDRVAQRLFAPEGPPRSRGEQRRPWWAAAGAFAVATALVIVVAAPEPGSRNVLSAPGDGLQSRQGGSGDVTPEASLRALRVRPAEGAPDVADLGSNGRVRAGDRVVLLYTNLGDLDRVAVERVTPAGHADNVLPMSEIRSDVEDERLHALIIDDAWAPGVHRLRARFLGPDGSTTVREVPIEVEAPEGPPTP
jgi:hypothetical protein